MCSIIGRVALAALAAILAYGAEPPKSWIDPDTGHRVVRLTTSPTAPASISIRTATRLTAGRWSTPRRRHQRARPENARGAKPWSRAACR